MTPDSPLTARICLGIVAAIALSIPLGITLNEANQHALLQKTGQVTDGRVTKKHCENHGKLAYAYTVSGQTYKGFGTLHGKSCHEVTVGDRIPIVYAAEKPQLSRSDSLEAWRSTIVGSYVALALVGLGALTVILRITRVDNVPRNA